MRAMKGSMIENAVGENSKRLDSNKNQTNNQVFDRPASRYS
jgi:hypothetical protein